MSDAFIQTGEVAGSVTRVQLPNISTTLIKIKAAADNTGNVYLGGSGVTVGNGTTDNNAGFQLDAGDETGWLPAGNLNQIYMICDNATDDIFYMAIQP